ncbi:MULTISPECIES: sensor histidine kinase [Streptosporangium]|uniref:Signal transduction histidine kinase n=1 Tax=Streptosporangium brasiliense TaxID=47480 RepID=A0ABT9RG21_9ACTN|nr:GAF domain-containing protein [Streptosporangium brasiliense]MDP9868217.1 signal transduction histidine kinase [Streptosporangium brasiliense]
MDEKSLLPSMQLDDLLAELQGRLEAVLATRDRVHALLEAVVSIGSDLDLETVLRRITQAATQLVEARYGALGVIGEGGTVERFIPVGMAEEEIARVDHWPHGKGLLGLLIKEPGTLRLADLTEHPAFYGFPEGHPPMRSFLGVPIVVREEVFGNLYLTEKAGGAAFEEEDEIVVGALATAAGVAIENARLYEESQRRENWLRVSTEVTSSLLSGEDPDEVLTVMARRAMELTGADTVTVSFPLAETMRIEIAEGLGAEHLRGCAVPMEDSLAAAVAHTGQPQTALDVKVRMAYPAYLEQVPLSAAIAVPLGKPQAVHGVLSLAKQAGSPPFNEADLRTAEALGGQAAVALELADARRDAERLGLLEDRDRIAKDLHDVVIQRLFAVAMTLMSMVEMVDNPTATTRMQHAVDELDQTIKEVRSTIFALQSPPQAGQVCSLRGQVTELVEAAREQLGFMPSIRMEAPLDNTVPEEVAGQLRAVLREALSNVARHARASRAQVLVGVSKGTLLLEVSDDGIGIPEDGRRSGLRNLADRAARLGGAFTAERAEGGGSRLRWRVPLARG